MSDATIAAGTEQRLTAQELKAQEKAAKKAEKERKNAAGAPPATDALLPGK